MILLRYNVSVTILSLACKSLFGSISLLTMLSPYQGFYSFNLPNSLTLSQDLCICCSFFLGISLCLVTLMNSVVFSSRSFLCGNIPLLFILVGFYQTNICSSKSKIWAVNENELNYIRNLLS